MLGKSVLITAAALTFGACSSQQRLPEFKDPGSFQKVMPDTAVGSGGGAKFRIDHPHLAGLANGRVPANALQDGDFNISTDLEADVGRLYQYLESPDFNVRSCEGDLHELYTRVFGLSAAYFDRSKWTGERLRNILQTLWQSRLLMRAKLAEFHGNGSVPEGCMNSIRDAMRAARFIEDYVGYTALRNQRVHIAKRDPSYRVAPYVINNPNPVQQTDPVIADPKLSKNFDLHSGDILLSRGDAVTSAAIARVGTVDAQFSHVAIAYVDPNTHEPWIIEALIESGSSVIPFRKYLSDGKTRLMQFRYHDGKIAHKAAELIFEKIKGFQDKHAVVNYDFKMDLQKHDELYCSEIINYAYSMAREFEAQEALKSGRPPKPVDVPSLFMTRIDMKNRDYLDRLGLGNGQVFAPADMEIDYRFDVVSEWRDLGRISQSWMMDMTLTKIYGWMEKDGYILHATLEGEIGAIIMSHSTTQWFYNKWLHKVVKGEPILVKVPAETVIVTRALDATGKIIFKKLKALVDKQVRENGGLLPTPKEMYALLDQVRAADRADYLASQTYNGKTKHPKISKKEKANTFHRIFRPKSWDLSK